MSPRGFEELVAEMLSRLGYEVTLTPASRDGGKDIYAARRDHLGTFVGSHSRIRESQPGHPCGWADVPRFEDIEERILRLE